MALLGTVDLVLAVVARLAHQLKLLADLVETVVAVVQPHVIQP
jgi:hypothetical protein